MAGFLLRKDDKSARLAARQLALKPARTYRHLPWEFYDAEPVAEQQLRLRGSRDHFKVVEDSVVTLAAVPNDPLLSNQGHIDPFNPDGDVHLIEAWDLVTSNSGIVIAIIDSGLQADHPDLAANLWVNLVEATGTPGFDDDGNGYIDDVNGWNAVNNNPNFADTIGHGTRVAGLIGAVGNNGVGVTGVCWRTRLLPLRSFQGTTTTTSIILTAFDYAFGVAGVRIVNTSFVDDTYSEPLRDPIAAAGHLLSLAVAAAGNNGRNIDSQPAYPASLALDNLITVGATDGNGNLWGGSNFGQAVSVVAPGTGMYSTTLGSAYSSGNGTSYSTPIVTGAAALLLGRYPLLHPAQIKATIRSTSRSTTPLFGFNLGGRLLDAQAMLGQTISAAGGWSSYE